MGCEESPLDKLRAAVQEFANATAEQAVLVDTCVVLWEQVSYDEDGEIGRRVRYTVPTDNFSLSAVLGLCAAGSYFLRQQALGDDGD